MLIPSYRHTAADLEWWRETEAADCVHGRTLAGKAASALQELHRFADLGPCYAATSWGKDSVALTHLLYLSGRAIPAVHIVQEGLQQDPYQAAVRDAFLADFPLDYREITVERLDRVHRDDGSHAPQLDEGIRRACRQFGTRRYIGGLRADESGARKIRARVGIPENSCWPLCWWKAADVFGWLALYDLPTHPAYAMTGGGRWDRNQIRVSTIGGIKGNQFGRREWEQEYYGDILRRQQARPARA